VTREEIMDTPNMHKRVYDSVVERRVFHLPNDTIREYVDDTYVERSGIVTTMALAGYIELGDEVSPPQANGETWQVYVETDLGREITKP